MASYQDLQRIMPSEERALQIMKEMVVYLGQRYENTLEDGNHLGLEQIRERIRQKDYARAFQLAEDFYLLSEPKSDKSLLEIVLEISS